LNEGSQCSTQQISQQSSTIQKSTRKRPLSEEILNSKRKPIPLEENYNIIDWDLIGNEMNLNKVMIIRGIPYEFDFKKFQELYKLIQIKTRDNEDKCDLMSVGEYISTTNNSKNIYAADIPLEEIIPKMKNDIEKILKAKLGFIEEDLFSFLPSGVLSLFVGYLGKSKTGTRFHVDKHGTLAWNLMVYGEFENTSKYWYFLKDPSKLSNYQKKLLYLNKLDLSQDELGIMNFFKYEQKKNELVIVPPLIPHSVENKYGTSFAVASNILLPRFLKYSIDLDIEYEKFQITSEYQWRYAVLSSYLHLTGKNNLTPQEKQNLIDIKLNLIGIIPEYNQQQDETFMLSTEIIEKCSSCTRYIANWHYIKKEKASCIIVCPKCFKEETKNFEKKKYFSTIPF